MIDINITDYVGHGHNRAVFSYKGNTVIKIPLSKYAVASNHSEYNSYLDKPDIIARTELIDNFYLIQEKLTDTIELKVGELLPDTAEFKLLNQNKLITKVAVGKCSTGNYVYYDYEHIKDSYRYTRFTFKVLNNRQHFITLFTDYIKTYGINKNFFFFDYLYMLEEDANWQYKN